MITNTINESQRNASRIAGLALLFSIVIVIIANYGISFRLIVPGNAAETARNIVAHELLYRINIACDIIYLVTLLVVLSAFHVVLGSVNRNFSLIAAFSRLVLAFMWGVAALNMLGALRLLGDASYLSVFSADQLQTLARLHLVVSYDAYYIGLPFWGLASTICSYLWFKSRYVPRSLAAYGLISSAWCVICGITYLVYPNFANAVGASWFDVPLVMFEIAMGSWLLFRGVKSTVS